MSAGATLDELLKWANGEYPRAFMAKVVAWNRLHHAIQINVSDASQPKK